MIVHHFATISLMVMSYSANMVRVGSLVLCVHDAVDYFLEVNKYSIVLCVHSAVDYFLEVNILWYCSSWFVIDSRKTEPTSKC